MKRYNHLYELIIDENNIRKAIHKASLKKKNRKSIKRVLDNEDTYIKLIKELLANKAFEVSPYKVSTIYDGARHKERTIYKPRFYPDQIVHWALMNVIGDLLEKRFYAYSCASIKKRGTDYAMKEVKRAVRNNRYCLKLDIKKFYPSVDKELMKQKFERVFKDKDVLWLINAIIDGNETQGTGLPIGNYTSQWFANFFLNDLDIFIKEKLKVEYYIRYMDDMVFFSNNKRKLKQVKKEVEGFLKGEHLSLKKNYCLIDLNKQFIDFLGYRFYKNHITLRRSNFLRIKRRVKKVYKKGYFVLKDCCALISYDGFLKRSNCYNYLCKYIYPYVSIKRCRKEVSYENRKQHKTNKQNAVLPRHKKLCCIC